ncbi:transposase, partial [Schaedlerella arabinosiphila]|nr:transposase [Schaedlerella arabinosiphila]
MNKSITQANQNDKQISKSIKKFFKRFHISSALKASNAYKKNGIPVIEIFQYLFLL